MQLSLFVALLLVSGSITFCVSRYIALSKNTDECDRLIAKLNEGHSKVLSFQVKDAASTEKFARDLADIEAALGSVELGNPELHLYRSQFVRVYAELGQDYQKLSQAWTQASQAAKTYNGQQQVKQAISNVKALGIAVTQAAQEADRLTEKVNTYCDANYE
jgi:hypothetical protein